MITRPYVDINKTDQSKAYEEQKGHSLISIRLK